ncbi:Lysosomal acid glucosylceramidase (Acid beta-glucosidase) (Beta-glucocerebrosidase) (Cholesterol glucosyltransferase) (SGTase) (Cholesteryl-beta-glucosidase) (D-glucosyl-N-acylsphingosine glucohydrolase) [Durusdinium trenchii]
MWPEKHIIMTEACQESGPRIWDWKLGERYAEAIIQDLEGWLEAWIDWNLILDETGGPNHVNNLVSAPVIYDTARDRLVFLSSFYYIGHFSRFIVPGAQRIAVASNRDKLKATGFMNPDGSVVTVVLNQEDYNIEFFLQVAGRAAPTQVPSRSIVTFRFHSNDVN